MAAKAHWCMWGAKSGLCFLNQQMSYRSSNCWKSARRWPGRMSHAFFSIMWMADCVQKKANRCKLGKRGPCHLCGCYFAPLTQALLQTACTHGNSTGSFRGLCGLPPIKNNSWWFKEHDSESECWLGLQIPQILTEPSICGICWTNKCDTWRPGWQLKGPEASVCISWYLTPLLDVSGLFE